MSRSSRCVLILVLFGTTLSLVAKSCTAATENNNHSRDSKIKKSSNKNDDIHVLLLGNSYTYYNHMPNMLEAMLQEGHDNKFKNKQQHKVHVSVAAQGGMDLMGHYGNANTPRDPSADRKYLGLCDAADNTDESSIHNNNRYCQVHWKWVILQDQSQTPGLWASPVASTRSAFEDSLYAAQGLQKMIEQRNIAAAGAGVADSTNNAANTTRTIQKTRTFLYETWGDEFGSRQAETDFYTDYPTMQEYISEGYRRYQAGMANAEHPVDLAPVGTAYRFIYDHQQQKKNKNSGDGDNNNNNNLDVFANLYFTDHKHPSVWGSYLAAQVMYATLTGWDPRELQFQIPRIERISSSTANEATAQWLHQYLATVAAHVVLRVPWEFPNGNDDETVETKDSSSSGHDGTVLDVSDVNLRDEAGVTAKRPVPNH